MKTIEELRKEYSEILQKCYDFVKNEASQSMRNNANRDVVDYYDDFACEIKKFLEQNIIQPEPIVSQPKQVTEGMIEDMKLIRNYFGENDKTTFEHWAFSVLDELIKRNVIQPEPQRVGEEDIWNKEQMEKVKDYILTESSKQTEEQKKHIIDFANRLSETKQEQKAMKSKHTAVDWLIEQLTPSISLQQKHIDDLKTQAKEIEKEQIMHSYVEGCSDSILDESTDKTRSEDYYNENYGK